MSKKFGSHLLSIAKRRGSRETEIKEGDWHIEMVLMVLNACNCDPVANSRITFHRGHLTQKLRFMEMLDTNEMERYMAFELKIQLNEPLENSKVLCKFLKISNSSNYNGIKIQE